MGSRNDERKRAKPKRRRGKKKKKRAVRVRALKRKGRIDNDEHAERRRHPRQPRRPRPAPARRGTAEPERSSDSQRQLDAFLARVYQHAARQISELEARERETEQYDQAEILERYARARASIIAALTAWEAKQTR